MVTMAVATAAVVMAAAMLVAVRAVKPTGVVANVEAAAVASTAVVVRAEEEGGEGEVKVGVVTKKNAAAPRVVFSSSWYTHQGVGWVGPEAFWRPETGFFPYLDLFFFVVFTLKFENPGGCTS